MVSNTRRIPKKAAVRPPIFPGRERDYLIENLSILIASGMSILEALDVVSAGIRRKNMRRLVLRIRSDVAAGIPFWQALERSGIFSETIVSLIQIGERSGRLGENMRVVSQRQEKERVFRSKIRGALMYPLFVLSVTFFVGVAIAWFILPRLAIVFSQLTLELPFLTRTLIYLGDFLNAYGAVVLPLGIGGGFLLVYILFFFSKTKAVGRTVLFYIPGVRRLIQETELARFGYLLGTLLQAELPITQALDSLRGVSFFPQYKKLYTYLFQSIRQGNSFKKSFVEYPKTKRLLPLSVQQLLASAEQSGTLPEMFLKISDIYEGKTETTTKNLTIILEPILLVIVWAGVVLVALAVILPIYNLIGNVNQVGL